MAPRKPAPEPYDPRAHGCMCRVCTDIVTVDPATLTAIPDEVVDTFEQGAGEATHASTPDWPIGEADAYVRGGIAAVWPEIERRVREQVAEEIERIEARDGDGSSWGNGMACAAEIARGEGT